MQRINTLCHISLCIFLINTLISPKGNTAVKRCLGSIIIVYQGIFRLCVADARAKTVYFCYTAVYCFYSRSRDELWLKGETSGNYQHVVSITADCDNDALTVVVEKDGPACHTGSDSCFTKPLYQSDKLPDFTTQGLYELLLERKRNLPEGSYTTYLFEKGIDKILKKVGEECTEVIIGGKGGDKKETVYEIADLAYHVMVLMVEMGITVEDITRELASRHVIDHKVKQEKMT